MKTYIKLKLTLKVSKLTLNSKVNLKLPEQNDLY